jgi:hypothetical protein
MKLRFQKQRNRALTFPEVLVVVAILVVFVYMFLPVLAQNIRGRNRSRGIYCVMNLKQVNLSFRIWEGDHDNKYPMGISVTNGGAMETTATGDVVNCYRVMSNELSTPMILVCPADWKKNSATNFGDDFNASHISYFIGVDAEESYPQRIMSGDGNFLINGSLMQPGLVPYSTNTSIA